MNAQAEAVRRLLTKASQDDLAARRLAEDAAQGDEVVGFHIQQALEKRLKALLTHRGVAYRRTHDLVELLDLLEGDGVALPRFIQACQELTPFAVDYRYETLGQYEEPPLDRTQVLDLLDQVGRWVLEQMDASGPRLP